MTEVKTKTKTPEELKKERFDTVLLDNVANVGTLNIVFTLDTLKKVSWKGIPDNYRALVWKILLGYAPPSQERRATVLSQKRQEYREAIDRVMAPQFHLY